MSFWAYLRRNWDDMLLLARDHAVIVAVAIAIATVLGIGLGVLTYRKRAARDLVLRITGVFLTIPSLALYALLITVPFLGMGAKPVVVALTLYALLPIVCNTVTGLLGVDAAIVESAQGMGMGQWQRLARIELPLAWPVIMTGIRVSTLLDALTEDLTEGWACVPIASATPRRRCGQPRSAAITASCWTFSTIPSGSWPTSGGGLVARTEMTPHRAGFGPNTVLYLRSAAP